MAAYLRTSRSAYYGVLAALPLLLAYELLLMLAGSHGGWQIRNAGDVWLRTLLEAFDVRPSHATPVMILLLLLSIPVVKRGDTPLRGTYCVFVVAEAFAYSLVFGLVINIILQFIFTAIPTSILIRGGFPAAIPFALGPLRGLALALGAGLFEEFIFRVLLLGGLLLTLRMVLPHHLATVLAIVLAALLFSAAHYVGPLGDTFTFASFLFRFVAGLLFTLLYYQRGFAVTAYTHAFYDMRLLLF